MKRVIFTISIAASAVLADSYTLDSLSITGSLEKDGARSVSKENIENRVGAGQTNPYKALDMAPSVHTGQVDSYGLSLDQNSFRIRGVYADTFSRLALTLDGVPQVVNVGQGAMGSTIDMENIASMSLISGAAPADKGFGFGDNAGSLDMKLIKPSDAFGMTLKQSLGSESFSRTFVRVDSGKFQNGVKLFVSASHSEAQKYRGEGEQKRENVELGATIPIGSWNADILLAYNDIKRHDYKALTYAQASDLDRYQNYDYDTSLTGKGGANDKYYYNFNRQHFIENLAQAEIFGAIMGGKLSFRPYYIYTDGYRFASSGAATSQVVKTEMTQNQYGLVAKYEKKIFDIDTTIGYWYQSIESIPPPTAQKNYTINKDGSLAFAGWGMLNDVGDRESNSPFVSAKKSFGALNLSGGLRYLSFKLPEIQGYTATGIGDISSDDAINMATKNQNYHAGAITFKEWLPSFAADYQISDRALARASYAKGYASPWQGPLWSKFVSNTNAFLSKGITLQNIWDKMKLETSDHYDLGLKIKGDNWSVEPTLYYVEYANKQVTVYDPIVAQTYYQSNAKAAAKGAELSGIYAFGDSLQLEGGVSYSQLNFTEDLTTTGGAKVASKGKQVPDAPKLLAKIAATAKYADFYVTPALKYVDKRYGDVLNGEYIAPYSVADLTIGYTKKKLGIFKDLSASLSLQNLLGRKYISIIKNDLDDTAAGSTTYYQGAPFGAVATLSMKF